MRVKRTSQTQACGVPLKEMTKCPRPSRPPRTTSKASSDGRVIYADGEKITDVMDHPVTRHGALSYSRQYARFHDPAVRDIFTAPDPETGEPVDLFLTPPKTADDLLRRAKALALSEELGYGVARLH